MNNLMDLGGGVGWLGTLLIGAVAGWIAEKLTRSDMGLIMNVIVGVIGAYIGAFLANLAGHSTRRNRLRLVLGQFAGGRGRRRCSHPCCADVEGPLSLIRW